MAVINKYNMTLLYNGQSKTAPSINSATLMKKVDSKIKNIEKMNKNEIKECKLFN